MLLEVTPHPRRFNRKGFEVGICEPPARVALERFVSQLEAFRNERILLLAPAFAQPLPSN